MSKNTWMHDELIKFDLDKLAINWDNKANILQYIVEIYNDISIDMKIKEMSNYYKKYHSLDNFSKCLQKLVYEK